jgi:uncharacterized phage protein gp47/JayE
MSFSRPTLTQLTDRISADFQTRITGANTALRRSVLKVLARVLAGAFHLAYGFLYYMSKQLFASSSDQDYLDRIASEYGIVRVAASKATGSGAVTGTSDLVIPSGMVLQSTAGVEYVTTTSEILVGSAAILTLEASEAGIDGNDEAGTVLSFTSPIAGVSSTCTVDSDGLTGGADSESDDALRARVLARKRLPPHGGSRQDYIGWAKEVSGVTRAWCFSEYAGVGTVALAFVRDGDTSIIPSAADRAAVADYIVEHVDPGTGFTVGIPVTAEPGFSVLDLTSLVVNFDISVYPNSSEVQVSVEDALEELILREGGPGETIYLSEIQQAISNAVGEGHHRLNAPLADVTASQTQVHIMGTVTFWPY